MDVGPVTVSLNEMSRAELLGEWGWVVDCCLPGANQWRRLVARGFHVQHEVAGLLGVLIQSEGSRIHVEWYDPARGEYLYAGHAQQLRHGAAYIVDARRHYGHPVAADPRQVAVPVVEQPAPPKPGDVARYCGSLAELRGQLVRVEFCDCDADDCAGYRAEPLDTELPGAVHVRSTSFAVEPV